MAETTTTSTRSKKPILPTTMLSHGTLECKDLEKSRLFFEEFLGLECVRHSPVSMLIRKNTYVAIVCVRSMNTGNTLLNHWGIDMASRQAVDQAYEAALAHKDTYDIKEIRKPRDQHGAYSFYMQDLDDNWWEIQCVNDGDPKFLDKLYERGDVA